MDDVVMKWKEKSLMSSICIFSQEINSIIVQLILMKNVKIRTAIEDYNCKRKAMAKAAGQLT